MKTKTIPAWPFGEKQVRILCPNCGRLHTHGQGDGQRSPHCEDYISGPKAYTLQTVPAPLPPEALEIDKQARRIGTQLSDLLLRQGPADRGVIALYKKLAVLLKTVEKINLFYLPKAREERESENN